MAMAWLPVIIPSGLAPRGAFQEKRRKILGRVIVTCASDGHVFSDHRVALLFELARNDRLERFRFNPEQLERRAETQQC